jgi:hypothetical protein
MEHESSLPDFEAYLESIVIDVDDPAASDHCREEFVHYARVITSGTELRLDPAVDLIIYEAQQTAITRKAVFFAEFDLHLEKRSADLDGAEKDFSLALKDPDGYIGHKLQAAQRRKIRQFVRAARADGKLTAEELVDFMVMNDEILIEGGRFGEARRSSIKGATEVLQRHGIEPTAARVTMLARRADVAASPDDEDDDPEIEGDAA